MNWLGTLEVQMVHHEEIIVRGQIARVLYEYRIPSNVTKDDIEISKSIVKKYIEREFKTPQVEVIRGKKKDRIAIKCEIESPVFVKILLESASEGILAAEHFLLMRSIEYERQG